MLPAERSEAGSFTGGAAAAEARVSSLGQAWELGAGHVLLHVLTLEIQADKAGCIRLHLYVSEI